MACRASSTYPPASKPHTAQTYSDENLEPLSEYMSAGGGGSGARCGSVFSSGELSFTDPAAGSWSLVDIPRQLALLASAAAAAATACESGGLATPIGGVHITAFTSAAHVADSPNSDIIKPSDLVVGCF